MLKVLGTHICWIYELKSGTELTLSLWDNEGKEIKTILYKDPDGFYYINNQLVGNVHLLGNVHQAVGYYLEKALGLWENRY